MDLVGDITATAIGKDAAKRDGEVADAAASEQVYRLLAHMLSADIAVQIALLNNRGLQAAYNELGIAEAINVEANLPPKPTFAVSRITTPVEFDVERQVAGDILALATLPARSRIAADRFHQAQLDAAEATLRVAMETRRNFYRAVASRQVSAFLDDATAAAATASTIAKRLGETGAMNKLDQSREQAFAVELDTQRTVARQQAEEAREALVRSLGLSRNDIRLKLPKILPALPRQARNETSVEIDAIRRRIDLQIARIEVDALAKSYGLVNATRFINLLEVAGISRTQREGGLAGTGGGVEVTFEVPIFDFGEARLRKAGEAYMAAVNRLSEIAVNVRSQARAAYGAYRAAYDVAIRFRDQVVPLRKVIADETTLRYGAMQIDVFALLAEARARIAADVAAVEAQRDFWLARTDLDAAVVGGGVTKSSAEVQSAIGASRLAAGQ
jgi:outer membrane protein TolC